MCKHISDKLYDYIFTIGILWIMLFGKHQEKSLELIRKTPKENISNLCKELRLLDNEEKAFLVS
ncbi:type III secretion protein, partial [Salmonella enterica subsp. arizonae serovar 18:z4,z23:-]|nr:type III secretion protein [Salmonella enterica subsp. arizonae serovar 18:z4,z23:-]